jgi:hypothetical protein
MILLPDLFQCSQAYRIRLRSPVDRIGFLFGEIPFGNYFLDFTISRHGLSIHLPLIPGPSPEGGREEFEMPALSPKVKEVLEMPALSPKGKGGM